MWFCVQHPKYNLLSGIDGDPVTVSKCCYYLHVLLHNRLNGNGQSQNNPPELMEFLWKCKNTLISMPVPPFHVEFWNEKLGLNYFWINEIAASTGDAHKLHASVVPHIDLTSLLPMWVFFFTNLSKTFNYNVSGWRQNCLHQTPNFMKISKISIKEDHFGGRFPYWN